MYYMYINKNFVHQVGDQPRLYYDAARSTNHQEFLRLIYTLFAEYCFLFHNRNMTTLRNLELCGTNLTFAEPEFLMKVK